MLTHTQTHTHTYTHTHCICLSVNNVKTKPTRHDFERPYGRRLLTSYPWSRIRTLVFNSRVTSRRCLAMGTPTPQDFKCGYGAPYFCLDGSYYLCSRGGNGIGDIISLRGRNLQYIFLEGEGG